MQIVLLERVGNLGSIGEVVDVRDGYARNFLLPQGKALRATKSNLAYFEAEKAKLEKLNAERKSQAEKASKTIDGKTVAILRAASEAGQLFGSVTTRDIADAVSTLGETVDRSHVNINQSFKTLGLFPVEIALHPEAVSTVTINIARNEDEAAIQEKTGRALTSDAQNEEEEEEYVPAPKAEAAPAEASEEATAETEEKKEEGS